MSALRQSPSGPATRRFARHDPSRETVEAHEILEGRATVEHYHDVRQEFVGGFAGPVAPNARVGTFGNRRRFRRQGNGIYAGDADRRRQGCFADAD